MNERKHSTGTGDDPLRAADSAAPEGGLHTPPSGVGPGAGDEPLDPELTEDLGPLLENRGDMVDSQLEAARSEAAEWRDKAMRTQAEFENTRKRLEARHSDAVLRASERVVESIIPVIDDFERAAEHVAAENEDLAQGVLAVGRKLLDVLGREGVSVIDPAGEAFDPNKHNAVQMREDHSIPDHTVVEVFQKGYEMHGRVLRPAMVVVSTGGPGRG